MGKRKEPGFEDLGFFFTGVMPGTKGGHAMVLQFLFGFPACSNIAPGAPVTQKPTVVRQCLPLDPGSCRSLPPPSRHDGQSEGWRS